MSLDVLCFENFREDLNGALKNERLKTLCTFYDHLKTNAQNSQY